MSYQVKLETFEGPLDLLLYLIRKNDMDICDIEISEITDQYLDFINAMRVLDVDLASEFIVMAATLIWIKSKMLLPKPEEESSEEEQDPREALMQRLIEYQKYKAAADELDKKPKLNSDLFKIHLVPERIQKDFNPKEDMAEVGVYELAVAFQDVIKRAKKVVHHIDAEEWSLEDKVIDIVQRLNTKLNQTVNFKQLFSEKVSRVEVVVTFMAILELTRMKCLKLYQVGHHSEIHLKVMEPMSSVDVNDPHFMSNAVAGGNDAT